MAHPGRVLVLAAAMALMPPPPLDLEGWAVENVVFGPESPLPGPYDPSRFPQFHRPLEVLSPEHPAREVVIRGSAQTGKTTIATVFIGGHLDRSPRPLLYTHPSEGNAARWVKTKLRPFIMGTASLRGLFPQTTSREAKNSTFYLERSDGRGLLVIAGANSAATLSMMSMPIQVQDDLSKWEDNVAGDPEQQADSRSMAFEIDAKILKISTPLLSTNCRITRALKASTDERWLVPCPHCGHRHELQWENMLAALDEAHPELAGFTCPDCGGAIEEKHRDAMNLAGEWVASHPGRKMIGFHFWAAQLPLMSWERIADRWLRAKGDPEAERAFYNDVAALPYDTAGEAPPWEQIRDRAEQSEQKPGIVPRGGLLLTIGADVQGDRVEWHLKAWGRRLQRWTVQYGVIHGQITEETTLKQLDALARTRWRDTQGNLRSVDMMAIDGGAWTADVLGWVRRHPMAATRNPGNAGVMMVRGARGDVVPELTRVKIERTQAGKPRRYGGRFWSVGVSPMKAALYQDLYRSDPLARGYCGFPAGLGDDFYQQITAERRLPVKRRDGTTAWHWVLTANLRNEVLDTELYAQAAAVRLGWRTLTEEQWARLEADREATPEALQLDIEEAMATQRPGPVAAPAAAQLPMVSGQANPTPGGFLGPRRKRWLG